MIEDQNTEFKIIWKDDYLKSICAFANAQGGTLYIGLDDNGIVTEIDNYKELLENLSSWISNSGYLPEGWTEKDLIKKHQLIPPNPDISKAFFRAGYIETWGRGIINIVEYCKAAELPVPDFKFNAGFTVLFKKENKSFEELSKIDYRQGEKTVRKLS